MGEERRVDKRAAQKRAWDEAHRLPCEICGVLTAKHAAEVGDRIVRCSQHSAQREAGRARRARIEKLWNEGLSMAEIAEEIGSTKGSINVEIVRMRGMGYDLPYRYPPERIEKAKRARGLRVR